MILRRVSLSNDDKSNVLVYAGAFVLLARSN